MFFLQSLRFCLQNLLDVFHLCCCSDPKWCRSEDLPCRMMCLLNNWFSRKTHPLKKVNSEQLRSCRKRADLKKIYWKLLDFFLESRLNQTPLLLWFLLPTLLFFGQGDERWRSLLRSLGLVLYWRNPAKLGPTVSNGIAIRHCTLCKFHGGCINYLADLETPKRR